MRYIRLFHLFSPRNRLASCISLGMMVTRFAWIAQRFVSSKNPTMYASTASCNALTAPFCILKLSPNISFITWRKRRRNGPFLIKSSVDFWYLRISLSAASPGRSLCKQNHRLEAKYLFQPFWLLMISALSRVWTQTFARCWKAASCCHFCRRRFFSGHFYFGEIELVMNSSCYGRCFKSRMFLANLQVCTKSESTRTGDTNVGFS